MGGYTEESATIQEYANLEESKKSLLSAVTTSSLKSVADRKEFFKTTYKKVEEMEEEIRKELRVNYEKWLFVLPSQTAGPTLPQRIEEEPPQMAAGVKTPTPKAVQELKPKSLLTQNMSRPDLLSWERSMRSYFKASNFEHCSSDIRYCYLEERMDPASQQLLRKLCNGEPEKYSMENLFQSENTWFGQTRSNKSASPKCSISGNAKVNHSH